MINVVNHSPGSQCAMILHDLQQGGTMTAVGARQLFGCDRLAARINDLRNEGYDIQKRMIPVQNRYGQTVRVAQYYIEA